MTIRLTLYSTSHCHLCEQAESMLSTLSHEYDLQWSAVEIANNSRLLDLYEVKIPVLKRLDNNHEICWPFTSIEIIQLVKLS